MKLVIDTRNGIAGDISVAGLLGLGASKDAIMKAMEYAGNKLGTTRITQVYHDNSVQLDVNISSDYEQLPESKVKALLNNSLEYLGIGKDSQKIARSILNVLCDAEKYVHAHDKRLKHMIHDHRGHQVEHAQEGIHGHQGHQVEHAHEGIHDHQGHQVEHAHEGIHGHQVEHGHEGIHDHRENLKCHGHYQLRSTHEENSLKTEAILHETQDIIIDVIGFIIGLQELGIDQVYYLNYVNVGNGTISFSHGTFNVPAPATEFILRTHNMSWQRSDEHNKEMTTPTGVSILAGCGAKRVVTLDGLNILKKCQARGIRDGLPPVSFYLIK